MKRVPLSFLVCFTVLMPLACAAPPVVDDYFGSNIFYKGDVVYDLASDTYKAGDSLETEITVVNMEDFPLVDASLVIDLVLGGDLDVQHPQLSDAYNIFHEEVIGGISIAPNSKKTIPFSYKLPEDLESGDYSLEVYFGTKRAPVVGIPFIHQSPKKAFFKVSGAGDFPAAKILRNETVFMGASGPVGVGVNASSVVKGTVYVQSASASQLSGLVLQVTVCEWDDTVCGSEERVWSKEYPVSIASKGRQEVEVVFNAPNQPDAYAVRLELKDSGGKTLSLYRSRIVVVGASVKIRKAVVDRPYYKENAKGRVMLLLGPSPDHYTLPVVRNARLSVSIAAKGGEKAYSVSEVIPELSSEQGLISKVFDFTAYRELRDFTVCSKIESEKGELYDSYCFLVDSSKYLSGENVIKAVWNYSYDQGLLFVNLCVEDASGQGASSQATAILLGVDDSQVVGVNEKVPLSPCRSVSFKTGPGKYDLLVNDLETNEQETYEINIEKKKEEKPAAICGDGRCDAGEDSARCCLDCGCAAGRECSQGACKEKSAPQSPSGTGNTLYYALFIALLIIIVFWIYTKKKGGGPKMDKANLFLAFIALTVLCPFAAQDGRAGFINYACDNAAAGDNLIHGSQTAAIYDPPNFDKGYVVDNGVYVICPQCKMSIKNIAQFTYTCSDYDAWKQVPHMVAWVYDSNGARQAISTNGITFDPVDRWQVIGPTSSKYGLEVDYPGNWYSYDCTKTSSSMDVYTFNNPSSSYTVYLDMVNAQCCPYYFCPNLAGSWRSTLCKKYCYTYEECDDFDFNCETKTACYNLKLSQAEGWYPQAQYKIMVLSPPSIAITAPAPITAPAGTTQTLSWTIRNTGGSKVEARMNPNCGGWTCRFVGYTANNPVILSAGQSYTVLMNVEIPASATGSKNVGIAVTYDDGYGLACMEPKMENSLISITVTPAPTTTSTTTTTTTTTPLPDLMISNIWSTGDVIQYSISNAGDSGAGASTSYLYVDGSNRGSDPVSALARGSASDESFAYAWICSGVNDTMMVCADAKNEVAEIDETNNCRTETWACPTTTTTTTTTSSSSTTTTSTSSSSSTSSTSSSTTTSTVPGTASVVFRYRATDDHKVAACTIWTDVFGTWPTKYKTDYEIENGQVNEFVIDDIPPGGPYKWTVSCIDDVPQGSVLKNAPNGYWTFTVVAPSAPSTSSTTTSTTTSTTASSSSTTSSSTTTSTTTTSSTTTLPYIIQSDSDVVLITDLSDSMLWCLDGQEGHCTGLEGNNPYRYQLARKLDKEFVDNVLGRPNNRVGLVTFSDIVIAHTPFTVGLTDDKEYLKQQIDRSMEQAEDLGTATCSCCGIRMARKILEEQGDPSRNRYIIFMSDGVANYYCRNPYSSMASSKDPNDVSKPECNDYYSPKSIQDAADSACDAKTSLGDNMWIYSVGMYSSEFASVCSFAVDCLKGISDCGDGETFIGTSTSELEDIYDKF